MKRKFSLLIWFVALFVFAVACEESEDLSKNGQDNEQTQGGDDEQEGSESDDEQDGSESGDEQEESQSDDTQDGDDADDDSPVDAYIFISSGEELAKIGIDAACPLSASYLLTKDITLTGEWTPIGSRSDSDSSFTGVFNGGGNTITGLTINSEEGCKGLFGYISGATIDSVIIKEPFILSGGDYVGAIAGMVDDSSVISNCGVEGGSVSGNSFVGGVVGCTDSYVISCYNTSSVSGNSNVGGVVGRGWYEPVYDNSDVVAVIDCYNGGTVEGSSIAGGVIGMANSNFDIETCCNSGNVLCSRNYIGGVVGWAYSSVTGCYNKGDVEGVEYVGGVVGEVYSSVTSCYSVGKVIASGTCVGGVAGHFYGSSYSFNCCYFIDQADDNAECGIGADSSTDYDYMLLSSVDELNAVVGVMNAATGDTNFVAGTPLDSAMPYLAWE